MYHCTTTCRRLAYPIMQAQLAFLRKAKWVDEASAELAERDPDLATSLRLALSESGAQGSSGGHAAATHVIDTLWRRVEDGAGWTEPFWRETYVLACVAAATHSADDVAALRHLDTAFIMGGPAEVLQPFVALVEPGALAAAVARRAVTAVAGAPPPCEPSLPCLSNELPRLNNPSAKEFLAFYRADRPVVMTGLTEDWEGRRSWGDLNWWSETHGHRFVPLECGAFNDAAWHEEVASIRDFVVRMREEIVYLAQHTLFEQLPSLCDDFQVPECLRGKVTRTNAWIGSQNTVTPLHFDSYDGTRQLSAEPLTDTAQLSDTRIRRSVPGGGVQARAAVRAIRGAQTVPLTRGMDLTAAMAKRGGGGRRPRGRGGAGHHLAGGCGAARPRALPTLQAGAVPGDRASSRRLPLHPRPRVALGQVAEPVRLNLLRLVTRDGPTCLAAELERVGYERILKPELRRRSQCNCGARNPAVSHLEGVQQPEREGPGVGYTQQQRSAARQQRTGLARLRRRCVSPSPRTQPPAQRRRCH